MGFIIKTGGDHFPNTGGKKCVKKTLKGKSVGPESDDGGASETRKLFDPCGFWFPRTKKRKGRLGANGRSQRGELETFYRGKRKNSIVACNGGHGELPGGHPR